MRTVPKSNEGPESSSGPRQAWDAFISLPDSSRWATRLRALGICRVLYSAGARTTNHVEHILHLAWKDRDKKAEHALRNLLPEIRGYKR